MDKGRSKRLRAWLPVLAIVLACGVAFSTSLPNDFISWDDDWLIKMNPWIRTVSWKNVTTILNPWNSMKIRGDLGSEYLPVRDLSHMIEYTLYGMKAPGYHVTNLLLHILVCLVLFKLMVRLSGKTAFSLAAVLLFSVHPFHVESVAWLAGRKDLLYALFFLLAILMWNEFRCAEGKKTKVVLYSASFVLFVLSCLSKTMAVTLPAVLLLNDWLLFRPREEGAKRRLLFPFVRTLPFFLFTFLFTWFVVLPIGSKSLICDWYGGGFGTTFLSAINAIRSYATEIFLPLKLQTCLDYPLTRRLNPATVLSALFLLGLIGFGAWVLALAVFRDKAPSPGLRLAGFASLFFFVSVSPVSNLLFPIGTLYAERYLYLALLGGPLLFAGLFVRLRDPGTPWWPSRLRRWRVPLATIVTGGVLLLFGVQTFLYNRAWKDGETLWGDVLEKSQGKHHQANYGLGVTLLCRVPREDPKKLKPALERAENHLRSALSQRHGVFFTNYPMVRQALSRILELQGRADEALQEIDTALAENARMIDEARNEFVRGERRTARARMLENRIGLLMNMNDPGYFDEAEESALQAIRIVGLEFAENPDLAWSYNIRGTFYLALGDVRARSGKDPTTSLRRAVSDCTHAILLKEDFQEAYENRGIALGILGNFVGKGGGDPEMVIRFAIMDFTDAIRFGTEFESREIYHSRGKTYHGLGDVLGRKGFDPRGCYRKAIDDQSVTLRANPNHPRAYNERGVAHSSLGDATTAWGKDAKEHYLRAIRDFKSALDLYPRAVFPRNNLGLTYLHLADAQDARGGSGAEWYEKARLCFEEVLRKGPKLMLSRINLGIALEKLGLFSRAVKVYEEALATQTEEYPPLQERLARARERMKSLFDPTKIVFDLERADAAMRRNDATVAAVLYGKAFARTGGALEDASDALKEKLARAHFQMARCRSLASAGKDGPNAPEKPVPTEEASALRVKSLSHLRAARELGWNDLDRLRNEPDLDPLRPLPAFQALLKEWEHK